MKKQQQNKEVNKNKQFSGSAYHEKHASHVADYGGNLKDPNAKGQI
ncbi:hypothetical protein R4Z10_18355 [Niallia sp. XMNu-256]